MCSVCPLRFDWSCGCNISSHFSMAVVGSNPGCHDFNFGSQVVDRDTQLSILVSFGCHPDTIRKLLIGIPRVQIPPASCWWGYHSQVVDRDTTRKTLSRWHLVLILVVDSWDCRKTLLRWHLQDRIPVIYIIASCWCQYYYIWIG